MLLKTRELNKNKIIDNFANPKARKKIVSDFVYKFPKLYQKMLLHTTCLKFYLHVFNTLMHMTSYHVHIFNI